MRYAGLILAGLVALAGLLLVPTTAATPGTTVRVSVDAAGNTPAHFRGPWETDVFERLLRNGIEWGLEARRAD